MNSVQGKEAIRLGYILNSSYFRIFLRLADQEGTFE